MEPRISLACCPALPWTVHAARHWRRQRLSPQWMFSQIGAWALLTGQGLSAANHVRHNTTVMLCPGSAHHAPPLAKLLEAVWLVFVVGFDVRRGEWAKFGGSRLASELAACQAYLVLTFDFCQLCSGTHRRRCQTTG